MSEDTTPKIRHHSNTISAADKPLNIDTSLAPPVRRNSEGSPRFPPNINVSEPTPLEPSYDKDNLFPSQKTTENEDDANGDDRSIISSNSNNYLNSPGKSSRKSRSRASSITSNIINEIKESSTIQKVASKIKSRHSLDESDIPDTSSSIAVSVPGVSGVYLANAKRNQDFHSLFRSVPEEDGLIEDFGCALQKEILLQGRIYISESYLCFNANIFGWVTNLVIAFADIIEIEKKSTAYFIPNAIQISTDSAKHFFASFLSRDQAYDLMIDIWRTARPDLAPPKEAEESIQNPEAESLESSDEDSESSYYDSDTEDSYSDETDSEQVDKPVIQDVDSKPRKVSSASATVNKETKTDPNRRRAMSEAVKPRATPSDDEKPLPPPVDSNTKTSDEASTKKDTEAKPQVHEKTECECNGDHFPNVVMDHTYFGSLEKFDDLLFKSDFMNKFLVDNQKSTEFEMGEWKKGEGKAEKVREYSYIKPLGGSIGPKSTKCYITQEILHEDFDKSVTSLATTSTPDVPSGGSFTCKTKTCLTYAGKGKVRMLVTVLVDFTKSSWLKSTIEKASIDGQQTYYKELDAEINAYIKQHPNEFGKPAEGKRKKRDKRSRHRRQRIPDEKKVEKEPPKSLLDQILGHITGAVNAASSPRAAHLTLFCLIIMVCVNLFIARKMAFVEQQLIQIGKSGPDILQESIVEAPGKKSIFIRQEEDDLWEWLCRVDPDKSNDITEQIKMYAIKDPKEQEVWDDAIKNTKLAKDRLDKHMSELTNMIQKAEDSLEDITKAVQDQRQKIKSQPYNLFIL